TGTLQDGTPIATQTAGLWPGNLDNVSPPVVITCSPAIVVPSAAGRCGAQVWAIATAHAGCSGVTLPVQAARADGQGLTDLYPVGTTAITWTATDAAGNRASCTQTVTVEDREKPVLTCPAAITTGTDPGQCTAAVNPGTATAQDNCPGAVAVSGTRSDGQPLTAPYPLGTTTITWSATDAAGKRASGTQTVTVETRQPLPLACPAPVTTVTDPGQCTASLAVFQPQVRGGCGGVTVSGFRNDSKPLGDPYPAGLTSIYWTATDTAGNQAA